MKKEAQIFEEFERLWANYRTCADAAHRLSPPHPEDDEFIKMAIVGFSYHQATEAWEYDHWSIARGYLSESEELGDPEKMKKFAMLAVGTLLGLSSAGKIDDRMFRIGYALPPGFIMGKGGAVDDL